jgi:hypothetical protein
MPYKLHENHVAEAFASGRVPHPKGPVTMKVVQVGNLVVTSQSVMAMDPIITALDKPFTQQVPNGRHPVTVAIADLDGDERLAFARVEFSLLPAVAWKMAVTGPEHDPATLGPGRYFGYGVSAGIGCFMDPVTAKLIGQRYREEGPYFNFGDVIAEETEKNYQHTRSWADIRPIQDREENIVCFYGLDSAYPSFFGFDAGGKVCQLITDFRIFADESEQQPLERRPDL